MLAVSEGLSTILKKGLGRCNLKPRNILVKGSCCKFHLLISDYGQANFEEPPRDSITTGSATPYLPVNRALRTDNYAPTEYAYPPKKELPPKYDIWSLGCVYLDVLSFLVWGHNGTKQLDGERETRAERIADFRF